MAENWNYQGYDFFQEAKKEYNFDNFQPNIKNDIIDAQLEKRNDWQIIQIFNLVNLLVPNEAGQFQFLQNFSAAVL